MNRKALALLIIFSLLVPVAFAGDVPTEDEIIKEISNNISDEYVTCAVYFSIGIEGLRRSGAHDLASKFEKHRDSAMMFALFAAKEGRTQEMAEKVTTARLEITMKSMLSEIDNDISNISILMNKYMYRCKEIMEDPDKLMKEWGEKILKKYNLN